MFSHLFEYIFGVSIRETLACIDYDTFSAYSRTNQARCLFDHGEYLHKHWDHSAEGILPGERFDANQQCMLKYGRDSRRADTKNITDICRDLPCQRDRYTWTSHPALEGTQCGTNMVSIIIPNWYLYLMESYFSGVAVENVCHVLLPLKRILVII